MTISTTDSRKSHIGNDVTTGFSFPYLFLIDTDLVITLVDDDTGIETTQVLSTDYTIVGAGNPAGGTVTMIVAPATGETLVISRIVELTQETDYITGDSFPAETHETALDKLTMIVQQLFTDVSRSIKLTIGVEGVDTELPTPEASSVIGWDLNGTALANYPYPGSIVGATQATEEQDATAGQTVFTLTEIDYATGIGNLIVFVNGVRYDSSLYTETNSTTVTFASGLILNDKVVFVTGDVVTNAITVASGVQYTPLGAGAVTTNVQDKLRESVSVKDFGAVGNGVADDTVAIQAAIDYAGANNSTLLFPSGTYIMASKIAKTEITSNLRIIGEGGATIKYTGALADYVFFLQATNGYDVTIDGLSINANLLASGCLRVNNYSSSMDEVNLSKLVIKNGTFKNGYLTLGKTTSAVGVVIKGGFSEVKYEGVTVRNISRDTGSGVPGTRGSSGISTAHNGINAYVLKNTLIDCEIDTITNNEISGDADDVDCDGVGFASPLSSAFPEANHFESTFVCRGTTFRNCKGRSVKNQVDGSSNISSFIIIRDLEKSITNGQEFNLQGGGGVINNGVIHLHETAGGTTTLGTSHAIVAYSAAQDATANDNEDGGVHCHDITIYNGIAISVDSLPFFMTVNNQDPTRVLPGVHIKRITLAGGNTQRIVQHSGGTAAEALVSISDVIGSISTALLRLDAASGSNIKAICNNNHNTNSGNTPDLIELIDNGEPWISASGNYGFNELFTEWTTTNNMGQILRGGLISGLDKNAHSIALSQRVTVADLASHNFKSCGNYGIYILTSSYGDTVQVMFAHNANSLIEITPASADVTLGSTSDPAIAGDLNIWIDSTTTEINITNRLGSSRDFNLFHFGGR